MAASKETGTLRVMAQMIQEESFVLAKGETLSKAVARFEKMFDITYDGGMVIVTDGDGGTHCAV